MSTMKQSIRFIAALLIASVLLFLVNRYLVFWHDWPDMASTFNYFSADSDMETMTFIQGLGLWAIYLGVFALILRSTKRHPDISLMSDADRYTNWAAYIIRAAFWSVFLIGLADTVISLLRVENLLVMAVGEDIARILEQARSRGLYVHYPLMLISLVIAFFTRSLGFIWLAFLVVLAEFFIVLSRFIFSYEQAFMGDLVRFWYAALFLFASAYTLVEGGHVRVDVLYANFSRRAKAWVNSIGSLILGLPLCWTILALGMGNKQGSLIAPIINFEISQSGYGLYVKYLMAAFLLIFAVSMAIQFVSLFLSSVAVLIGEVDDTDEDEDEDEDEDDNTPNLIDTPLASQGETA